MTPKEIEKRAKEVIKIDPEDSPDASNIKLQYQKIFAQGFTEGLSEKETYAKGKVEEYKRELVKKVYDLALYYREETQKFKSPRICVSREDLLKLIKEDK